MTRSLRSRLMFGMLLSIAVLLAIVDITIYTIQRRQLLRAFDDTLQNSANALALLVQPGPFGFRFDAEGLTRFPAGRIREGALYQFWSDQLIDILPPAGPGETAEQLVHTSGFSQESDWPIPLEPGGLQPVHPPLEPQDPRQSPDFVWGGRQTLVVRSPALGENNLPRIEARNDRPRFEFITLPDGRAGRAVAMALQLPSREPWARRLSSANLTIVVAADTAEVRTQLRFLAMILAVTALGAVALSGGVAWLVVARGLSPLSAVAGQIAMLDDRALSERVGNEHVPIEVKPIVLQLNGLLGRLEKAFERERSMTADVAHELRTPLSELRAIAEITLTRQRDPDEYRRAFEETLDTLMNVQAVAEKLLSLARMEAGLQLPELEPLMVGSAVQQHWPLFQEEASRKRITFENRCPQSLTVIANAQLLDIVLSNALSNAVTYCEDGGEVIVESTDDNACCLRITNTSHALTGDELSRVFDRFWRGDEARSDSGQHCGIGLTLVRRAMQVMDGQADAAVDAEGRFVLTLRFRRC